MSCEKSVEITAFLKGEVPDGEREALRAHFERCAPCSGDLARQRQILQAVQGVDRVEPSPTFTWRVREAFLRAHPEYLQAAIPDRLTLWERVRATLRASPAWAISIGAHAVLLTVLAVLIFSHHWTGQGREGVVVYKVRPRPADPPDRSGHVVAEGSPARDFTPGAALDPSREKFDDAVRGWRERLGKDRGLAAFFARRKTQGSKTVRAALDWLARAQKPDGGWAGPALKQEDGLDFTHSVGVTGLALLAFLGDGETPASGEHAETVRKGLRSLLAEQRVSGLIGPDRGPYLYDHAVAALALVEAWMATRDESLAPAAAAAVNFSAFAQNGTGGWGYEPRAFENDTSVGCWHVQLLRLAELDGNAGVLSSLVQADARVQAMTDPTGKVGYRVRAQFPNGPYGVTAAGMLTRELAGASPDAAILAKQGAILLGRPAEEPADLYFAYLGSLAMFQLGGDAWSRWWEPLRERIVSAQRQDGSWPPELDRWQSQGGAAYVTALAALVLEAPFRYPRLAE